MNSTYRSFTGQGLGRQFLHSLREPDYWAYSSWLEIATKYRRTSLGLLWLCLPTAVFIIVLGNVYSHLMDYAPAEYLPYLGAGYVTWRFMVQVINDAVGTFAHHKAYIMEGRIRLTDFILTAFSKALFHLFFGVLVVVGVFLWSPEVHLSSGWTLLITFPLLVINMAWIAVCVALVGARFPDTHELIGTVLVLGLLLTPILWPIDKFPADSFRGVAVRFNPAFHLIDVVRAPVLGGMPEQASVVIVIIMAVLGWIVATLLFRRYSRYVPLWV